MKRVVIVGCPGAGKTTFANMLGVKTGIPVVHLDYYYHDKTKDYYNEQNKSAWRAKVHELMQAPEWIIDGNYSSTFEARFKQSDTIIFLDYPRFISLSRVLKRIVKAPWTTRHDMPGDWEETVDLSFLKFVWNFNKKYRHKITDVLDKNSGKNIHIFKSPSDAERYLKTGEIKI